MFQYNWQKRVVAASLFISLFAFLLIGYLTDTWHPTWLVFLFVPLAPFIVGLKKFKFTFPLAMVIAYVTISIFTGWWDKAWIVFLLIPIYQILFGPSFSDSVKKTIKKSTVYTVNMDDDDQE